MSQNIVQPYRFSAPASETCYTSGGGQARITSISQLIGLSVTSGTDIVGKDITEISFYLKLNGSPTGTVYVRGWDSAADIPSSPAVTFGSFDASTLGSSFSKHTFTLSSGTFSVAVGSQIGLDWGAGSHSDDIYMQWANTDTTNGNMWVDSYTQAYEIIGGCPNYCWYG